MGRFGAPEWATESRIWIFAAEVYNNAWALGTFWVLVGILVAIWVVAYMTYEGKVARLVAAGLNSALVVATWASVLYRMLDGFIWPYIIVVAIWGLLTVRFGKLGFILGAGLFFSASMSFYLASEWWAWAESF